MFDLERAVTNWRKQMLAAGTMGPSTLNELESHLREEIDELVKSGVDGARAFDRAVANIGEARPIAAEFTKANLDSHRRPVAIWGLAALWMAGCLISLNTVCRHTAAAQFNGLQHSVDVIAGFIYVAGILGCVLLFFGARWGAYILRSIALLFFIVCIAQLFRFNFTAEWRIWCSVIVILCLVTIGLLHGQAVENLKPRVKA